MEEQKAPGQREQQGKGPEVGKTFARLRVGRRPAGLGGHGVGMQDMGACQYFIPRAIGKHGRVLHRAGRDGSITGKVLRRVAVWNGEARVY